VSARACICCSVAAFTLLLLVPGAANAAFLTPEYDLTFAGAEDHQIGEATAVAVDEQTHDVYVADRANHRISKFDSEGNFLFMFGDGVNETTGGDRCPIDPGDECRPATQASPSFPDFANPTAIVVDNSGGPFQGSVYVADGTTGGGDGTIAKFDSQGQPVAGWGSDGRVSVVLLQKVGISPVDGSVWALDGEVVGSPGGQAGAQISVYEPDDGSQRFRREQKPTAGGDGSIAVDLHDRLWFSDHNMVPLKEDITRFDETGMNALGRIDPGVASGFAANPVSGDVLAVFNFGEILVFRDSCEPALGFCTPKESFGGGQLSSPTAVAVDGSTNSVYVATFEGIAAFRSLLVPDVVPAPTSVGRTDAIVNAHLDPVGGGDIVGCEVEYGPTTEYGSTAPCDQTLPLAAAADVTAHLSGLSTETTYHFRFRASNGNGTSVGPDRQFTPHWVTGLETLGATDIGPGSATLHGELNPEGESTDYYFEWGEGKDYGHLTPSLPGSSTSAPGLTSVETDLTRVLTAETTYHYRLVAVNSLGTSYGADREFTTADSEPPQIRNTLATPTSPTSVVLHTEINPGFGDTGYRFQWGPSSSYGQQTVIGSPLAGDGEFHPVDVEISGLAPDTTYHFRAIAFNFGANATSGDLKFTTPPVPVVAPLPPPGGDRSTPAPPPSTKPKRRKRCRRNFVRKKGKCVKKRSARNGRKGGRRR
jgi:hypothetical protein